MEMGGISIFRKIVITENYHTAPSSKPKTQRRALMKQSTNVIKVTSVCGNFPKTANRHGQAARSVSAVPDGTSKIPQSQNFILDRSTKFTAVVLISNFPITK